MCKLRTILLPCYCLQGRRDTRNTMKGEVTGYSNVCSGDRAGSQVCGIPFGNKVRDEAFDFFQLSFNICVWKQSVCYALIKITFMDVDFFRQ